MNLLQGESSSAMNEMLLLLQSVPVLVLLAVLAGQRMQPRAKLAPRLVRVHNERRTPPTTGR